MKNDTYFQTQNLDGLLDGLYFLFNQVANMLTNAPIYLFSTLFFVYLCQQFCLKSLLIAKIYWL